MYQCSSSPSHLGGLVCQFLQAICGLTLDLHCELPGVWQAGFEGKCFVLFVEDKNYIYGEGLKLLWL